VKHLESIVQSIELVAKILYIAAAASICASFLLMFLDASGRFLFNHPIAGTAEVGGYLVVAIAFLALGYAQLKGAHVKVELFTSRLPQKLQSVLYIFVSLLAITFFVVMARQAGERAYVDWAQKVLLSPAVIKLPVWIPSFIAALGCAIVAISLLTQVVRRIVKLVES